MRFSAPCLLLALCCGASWAQAAPDEEAIQVQPLPEVAAPADAGEQAIRSVELDPVVVTGTRTEQPLSRSPVEVQLVGARQIANSGARDLAELLEREGGVYVSRVAGRGTSIEIQGLASDQILVLVDGRRMIGRINGAIDLSRLRLDAIERVEIVKGPSSALYGADAMGGVVNIITRRDGRPGGELSARVDSGDNRELLGNAGWTLGPVHGRSNAGYFKIAPFDLDESTTSTDGIEGETRFAGSEAEWRLSERASLGLSGSWALDDSHRIDAGTGGRVYDTRKRIEDIRTGLAPRYDFGEGRRLALDLYYNRYFDQFLQQQRGGDGSNDLDEETLNQLGSLGAQYDHRLGAHGLSLGAETSLEQLDADRLSQKGERDRQSLYLQDDWRLSETLRLVPGLRYDRDSQFGAQLSPKLALRWDFASDWFLRAGYGRGYRAPDFKQLLLRFSNAAVGYRVDGNPDLQPERSSGYNLGLTWLPSTRFNLSLSAYHNRVSDLIDVVQTESGPPIVFSYVNVARATLNGLDLQGRWRPWQPLELQLGYGYLRSRDEDSGEELSGRARHRANAALRYERAHSAWQLRGVWVGKRVFGVELDTGGAPTGAGVASDYALFDARAELKAWEHWRFAVGVENLLDEGDVRFLPIAPRNAYLELRWSFE